MSSDIPAYGGFREVRGYGLGRLGPWGTGVVAVVAGVLAFSTAISLWAALYGLVAAVPIVAMSVIPVGTSRRTVAGHVAWWARAWWGRRSGSDAWVADVFEEVPRGDNLPGVLAPLMPLDVEDGRGGKQCLIWNRRTGVLSAILLVSPTGITLSDQDDANSWAAAYGDWLADLASQAGPPLAKPRGPECRPAAMMAGMRLMKYWPLAGLRLRTPRLELRLPNLEDLGVLAGLAAGGVHDPAVQPFTAEWTDAEPDERAQLVLRWHWRCWADWQVDAWALNLVVLRGGELVGTQTISAKDFAVCCEVNTGSWLGHIHHGQGIGTEMRAAVLELAFAHLRAESAVSGAFEDNLGSYGVSRKLGYEPDGLEVHAVRGKPAVIRRLRLTRGKWEAHRSMPVEVTGLAECLPLFGARIKP